MTAAWAFVAAMLLMSGTLGFLVLTVTHQTRMLSSMLDVLTMLCQLHTQDSDEEGTGDGATAE